MFNARIHPELYTNSLTEEQLDRLHQSLLYVCEVAVSTLAERERFPANWLMKYRWGKGKKINQLPTGEKITFLTVGGRTSAIVPSVQKKTGPVAGDVERGDDSNDTKNDDSDNQNGAEEDKSEVKQKRKRQNDSKTDHTATETSKPNVSSRNKRIKAEEPAVQDEETVTSKNDPRQADEAKSSSAKGPGQSRRSKSTVEAAVGGNTTSGRRRSARVAAK